MSALDQSGPQSSIGAADFAFNNPVSNLHGRSSITSSRAAGGSVTRKDKRSWRPFRSSRATRDAITINAQEGHLCREESRRSYGTTNTKTSWWTVHLFRGMVNDIKRRAPFYWSDWTDAWDYRVVPATVYMYFAKYVFLTCFCFIRTDDCSILPALAFSLDMFEKTSHSYGVNEVLLASVLGSVVFAVLAAQPLVIVGVTGEFNFFFVIFF
jgi:hypothetical protein